MTRAELAIVRRALAIVDRELANDNHSGSASAVGIAAPAKEDRCDEATNRGSMDPISTENSGESTSALERAEEDGRRLIEAIQRGQKPTPRSRARGHRRRALP